MGWRIMRIHGPGARASLDIIQSRLSASRRWRMAHPLLVVALAASALGGCASTQSVVSSGFNMSASGKDPMFPESKWGTASRRVAGPNDYIPKGGGVYKVGEPYQVGGRWYNPREQPDYDRIGIASWYGSDFHGRRTANGETYDMFALTAAHPTLPLPSYAYVTNLANNRTILVRVNDRGPYVGERMIDLSKRSAETLGLHKGGTGRVRVRYAGPAPLDGDDRRERQFLASRSWNGEMNIAAVERAQSAREWAAHRSGMPPPSDVPMQEAPAPYAHARAPSVAMAYENRPQPRSSEPRYGEPRYGAPSYDERAYGVPYDAPRYDAPPSAPPYPSASAYPRAPAYPSASAYDAPRADASRSAPAYTYAEPQQPARSYADAGPSSGSNGGGYDNGEVWSPTRYRAAVANSR